MISNITISDDLKNRYPGIKFGYIITNNIVVQEENDKLEKIKRNIEKEIREKELEYYKNDGNIKGWLDLFREMELNPNKTPPAQYALIKRIIKGNPIPKINTIVDIANVMAAKSRLPVGAFDIEHIKDKIELRLSMSGEKFHPLFSDEFEEVPPNEVVYSDSEKIFSRYSKDCDETKITDKTKSVFFVIDGTKDTPSEEISKYLDLLENLLKDVSNANIIQKRIVS
jgi:DNA/RNA-binding domain of Phe-tRNA-synthetase-like protein